MVQKRLPVLLATLISVFGFQSAHAETIAVVWDDAQGFVSAESCAAAQNAAGAIRSFEEFVGRVGEITSLNQSQLKLPSGQAVLGTFWELSLDSGTPVVANCGGQDFVFFDVYSAGKTAAVARVGLNSSHSDLFRGVQIREAFEAEAVISDREMLRTEVTEAVSVKVDGIDATAGSLEYVACTTSSQLNVRNDDLSKVLFTVNRYETILPVQSFGTDSQEKVIDGKSYTFVKVQVPNTGTGWVADSYVKLRSDCAGAPQGDSPQEDFVASAWTFPTLKRPSSSYKQGMMRFKASRSGGKRLHAACDLYRVKDEAVNAVTGGTVIRDKYYFYEGTYAIEIRHTGGRVVRYGEITGKSAPSIALNKSVKVGQTVGYVGKVNSGCCTPMLHFEMYSGSKSGALTQSGNKFNRRSDLMDPTSDLVQWEKSKFGVSY